MSPEEFVELLGDADTYFESGSFREPLEQTGEVFRRGFHDNFMRAAYPDGSPWPQRKDNLPHPLLRLSEDMLNATTQLGAMGNIAVTEDREASLGVNGGEIPYAATQQYGRGPIPPRTYVYATEAIVEECGEILKSAAIENAFGQ
jgi:hypothetical protein